MIAASVHGLAVFAGAAGDDVALDDRGDSWMRAAAELVWLEASEEVGQKAAADSRRRESASTGENGRTLASANAESPLLGAHAAKGAGDPVSAGGVAAASAYMKSALTESAFAESAFAGTPTDAGLMLGGVWGSGGVGDLAGRHALGVRRVGKLDGSGPSGSGPSGSGPSGSGPSASKAHGPRLQPVADPCHGMFPLAAEHDRGSVVVALRVSASGVPTVPRVIEEFPAGEGFAEAARACLPRLRFEPAADSRGTPVTAESVVRLKFSRG